MREIINTLKFYGIIDAIPLAFTATFIYAVIRVIYLRSTGKTRESVITEAARGLLIWYLITLVIVVWLPQLPLLLFGKISPLEFAQETFFRGEYANNRRFLNILCGRQGFLDDAELVANVELFVPFGVLLPLSFRRLRWWAADLIGLGATVLIELVQPFVGRSFDIDDIIANTIGMVIGCAITKAVVGVYALAARRTQNNVKQ